MDLGLSLTRRQRCVTSYYASSSSASSAAASSSSTAIDMLFRLQRNSRYGRFAYDDDMSSDEDERFRSSSSSSASKQKVRYFDGYDIFFEVDDVTLM